MKIVTMGELMLRLSPLENQRFTQAQGFEAAYGGAEANVAVCLAQFMEEVYFLTKLPKNDIAQAAINGLRKFGVDTRYIARGGDRMGLYYLEKGASQRPSKVVYDRAYSSISEAAAGDFDFDAIFRNCGWFHFTGITPALSDAAAQLTAHACRQARAAGAAVSCDLNYRSSLWSREKAGKVLSGLMEFVDVCITNPEQTEDVFGIQALNQNETEEQNLKRIANELKSRFGVKKIAFTQRKNISASDNVLSAYYFNGNQYARSGDYSVHIVDRVGGGDAFAAGLICGIIQGFSDQQTVEFASAANCIKHSIPGDFCLAGLDEIMSLAQGDGAGRIQR